MKKILALLVLSTVSVFATPQSRTDIKAANAAAMPSGVQNAVSAQKIRDALSAVIDNAPNFKTDGIYNVLSYGAIGNGVADDTTAITACFAAAPAGSTIVFPAGTYVLRNYITIGVNDVTIIGYGATLTSDATGQDRKFLVSGKSGIKFIGLKIDGGERTTMSIPESDTYTPANNPGTIHFVGATNCAVSACEFKGVNFPVTILGGCDGITVEDCRFSRYYSAIRGYFSGSGVSEVSPHNIKILSNTFKPGLHPFLAITPSGSAVSLDYQGAYGSGAIRFRGHNDLSADTFGEKHHISIIGNSIESPGGFGIELQTVNDSCVVGNQVYNTDLGISISFAQRIEVSANSINMFCYCGIEVDGNNSEGSSLPGSDSIILSANSIDGRDQYCRTYANPNHYGIVITNRVHGVSVTGGEIRWSRTGIGIFTGITGHEPANISISNMRIETNDESGVDGGLNSGLNRNAVYVENARDVTIRGLICAPGSTAWQRAIYLATSARVNISNSSITSNKNCVYIHNSTDVIIDGNILKAGSNLTTSTNFIQLDSTNVSVERVQITSNKFIGTMDGGIGLYSPANHISGVSVSGCDTREAAVPSGQKFLVFYATGTGSISDVVIGKNIGPGNGAPENNIDLPTIRYVTGTFTDDERYETIFCEYDTTVNLQSAVGRAGKKKSIFLTTGTGTLTIHPSENINGSSANRTVTTQWGHLDLLSDGANWVITN